MHSLFKSPWALRIRAGQAIKARRVPELNDPGHRLEIDLGPDWQGPKPTIHPGAIKGYERMSDEEITQATRVVAAKIKGGKALLGDMCQNPAQFTDPRSKPGKKEVSDLMWFLRIKAEEVAQSPFEKGALSIPDPANVIRGYLDRCPDAYNRLSSHLPEQQALPGGSPRGIDFDQGDIANPDELLPYGMGTLLMQSTRMSSGDERLFIKLEGHGTPMPLLDDYQAWQRGAKDASTLPASRDLALKDAAHTAVHAGKYLLSKFHLHGQRLRGLPRFTENQIDGKGSSVSRELVPAYRSVIAAARAAGLPVLALQRGNFEAEIHAMVDNLETFLQGATAGAQPIPKPVLDALGDFDRFVAEHKLFEASENRHMSEVVLTRGSLGV